MSLLVAAAQLLCRKDLPLGPLIVQVQMRVRFRIIPLRVKSKVLCNKPLPHARLIRQVDLVHLVARQLMGSVDLSQEFLCGQFPLNIFLPCQPSILAPLVVLLVVHVHQVGTVRRCRVDPPQQAGIHSVPQLFTDQERLILRSLIQPCQIRATLFAALPIGHPVTVPGGLFRFRDEIAPAVVTYAGTRKIVLPPSTAQLLRERKKTAPTEWIFPNPFDPEQPIAPGTAYNRLKVLLKEAGLPDIRFHDLRHTFATHALSSGVDAKTLAGILGHTKASFTLDTYTHTTGDMQKRAAEIVGGFLTDYLGEEMNPWQSNESTAAAAST